MSKYMDREGFLRNSYRDAADDIRKCEAFVYRSIKRGASLPEAALELQELMHTALWNVSYLLVPKKYPDDEKQRRQGLRKLKKQKW